MSIRKYVNMQVRHYISILVCKYVNIQVHQYTSTSMHKYISAQVRQCISTSVRKSVSAQVRQCASSIFAAFSIPQNISRPVDNTEEMAEVEAVVNQLRKEERKSFWQIANMANGYFAHKLSTRIIARPDSLQLITEITNKTFKMPVLCKVYNDFYH